MNVIPGEFMKRNPADWRRSSLLLILLMVVTAFSAAQPIRLKEPVNLLALGDSYTIGQSVNVSERWPVQLTDELRSLGYLAADPAIIAQTGWRTDNLQAAVDQVMPLSGYNLVSLLIGVNNQFQGRSIEVYAVEFEALLDQAIWIAGNNPHHVFVLSIPDYAYTPFGGGNTAISAAIDAFNEVNRSIAGNKNVRYVDITPISRQGLAQPSLVADDGLHPSGEMYALWVKEIVKYIERETSVEETGISRGKVTMISTGDRLAVKAGSRTVAYSFCSLSGAAVLNGSLFPNEVNQVETGRLSPGIYLLLLRVDDGSIVAEKVLVQGR